MAPGERFSHQIWGFTKSAGNLASGMPGVFVAADPAAGTRVRWSHMFAARDKIDRLALSAFVSGNWAGFIETPIFGP